MSKILKTSIQNKIDTTKLWEDATFKSLTGEMYIYRVDEEDNTEIPKIKFGDGSNSVNDLKFTSFCLDCIDNQELVKLAVPRAKESVKYNGTSQSPEWLLYNADKMDIGGTISATVPGTYTVTFKPRNGYCWEDETTDAKSVEWFLVNGDATIEFVDSDENIVSLTSVTLDEIGVSQGFDFQYTGGSSVTVQSSNTNYVTATINGFGLWLTPGEEKGTAIVTLTVVPTEYYNGVSKQITVINNAPLSITLQNNSWEEIKQAINQGEGENYWELGDTKTVNFNHINIGNISYNQVSINAFILEFDHDGETNTADFGLGLVTNTDGTKYNVSLDGRFNISTFWYVDDAGNTLLPCLNNIQSILEDENHIVLEEMSVNTCYIEHHEYVGTAYTDTFISNRSSNHYIKIPSAKEIGKCITDGAFGLRLSEDQISEIDNTSSTYQYFAVTNSCIPAMLNSDGTIDDSEGRYVLRDRLSIHTSETEDSADIYDHNIYNYRDNSDDSGSRLRLFLNNDDPMDENYEPPRGIFTIFRI